VDSLTAGRQAGVKRLEHEADQSLFLTLRLRMC
jgi:hypothetical protein